MARKKTKIEEEEEYAESFLQELETLAMAALAAKDRDSVFNLQGQIKVIRIQMALAGRAYEQAKKVIRLTWAVTALTVALLLFTAYLCYDAYLKSKGHEQEYQHATQPSNAP